MTSTQVTRTIPNPPAGIPRILAHLTYDDVDAAIEWLGRAFGFRERVAARHSSDGVISRSQLDVEDSVITIGLPGVHGDSPRNGVSTMLYVYVDDVEGHYQRACAENVEIVLELDDRPWGDRRYQANDLEGHRWTFAEHVVDVDHAGCADDTDDIVS